MGFREYSKKLFHLLIIWFAISSSFLELIETSSSFILFSNNLSLEEVLSLTYQKKLFEDLGFKEISKESLPEHKIWADCIRCKHFPVCDEIALLYKL